MKKWTYNFCKINYLKGSCDSLFRALIRGKINIAHPNPVCKAPVARSINHKTHD